MIGSQGVEGGLDRVKLREAISSKHPIIPASSALFEGGTPLGVLAHDNARATSRTHSGACDVSRTHSQGFAITPSFVRTPYPNTTARSRHMAEPQHASSAPASGDRGHPPDRPQAAP